MDFSEFEYPETLQAPLKRYGEGAHSIIPVFGTLSAIVTPSMSTEKEKESSPVQPMSNKYFAVLFYSQSSPQHRQLKPCNIHYYGIKSDAVQSEDTNRNPNYLQGKFSSVPSIAKLGSVTPAPEAMCCVFSKRISTQEQLDLMERCVFLQILSRRSSVIA